MVDEWFVVGIVGGCEDWDNYWEINIGNATMGLSDAFPALIAARVAE